jgi:hypothetical protein
MIAVDGVNLLARKIKTGVGGKIHILKLVKFS